MADYGSCTVTEVTHTSIKKIRFDWTSENGGGHGGEVTKTTTNAYDGCLERVVFIPGSTTPDNLYDVYLNDPDGNDVLAALGVDLSNAAAVVKTHANGLTAVAGEKLTLSIAHAGNAKTGTVIVYLR